MKFSAKQFLAVAGFTVFMTGGAYGEALGRYGADADTVTISGISSGGMMTVQAHVAYSGTFKGAAVFAAMPYYCVQGEKFSPKHPCVASTSGTDLRIASLVEITKKWAAAGIIDPVANLNTAKVYIFHGTQDTLVHPGAGIGLNQYYRSLVKDGNIIYDDSTAAEHAWITWQSREEVNSCTIKAPPFISNCNTDPQKTFLQHFYGSVSEKVASLTGAFVEFDQTEFFNDGKAAEQSVADTGWVYIPAACNKGNSNCRAHVALHGCTQSHSQIGDQFIKLNGLNEYADSNKMIVIYPQTKADPAKNPYGCWDFWGYTGDNYAQKSGPQPRMLKRIVDRVTTPG